MKLYGREIFAFVITMFYKKKVIAAFL